MPSRAAAVRELLKRGLHAEGFEIAKHGKKSQDYGMTSTGDGALSGFLHQPRSNRLRQLPNHGGTNARLHDLASSQEPESGGLLSPRGGAKASALTPSEFPRIPA
jgi:hypothetical protein